METQDVIIIGAGAAGLMCAIEAGKRGRRVLVIDHAKKPAEKIRISGGGRCNFTNLHTSPRHFLSHNPSFCASALARYTPEDFIALMHKYRISFHEKTLGQLFCDHSAGDIIRMLLEECTQAGVILCLNTSIHGVEKTQQGFAVTSSEGTLQSAALVVACGGLSIPKMGATGLGYAIARQFGLPIVDTQPALVPFTLPPDELAHFTTLSGIALEAATRIEPQHFREGLLFTHRGLSGPAILQISSYWKQGQPVTIDLLPGKNLGALLVEAKTLHPNQELATALAQHLPKRVATALLARYWPDLPWKLTQIANKTLQAIGQALHHWCILPNGTEGYRTAEVTLGGVDTRALSSHTMECASVPGLFFIGEVVDVTGHLGGFNFQWAWSSGYVAGQHV